jgi:hypothetical protein
VALETGEVKWTEKGIGFGALMAADGKLIVQTDKGELVVAKAIWRHLHQGRRSHY